MNVLKRVMEKNVWRATTTSMMMKTTRVDMTDEMFERLLSNVYDTFGPVPFDTEDEWMQIMKDNTVTETRLKRVSVIEGRQSTTRRRSRFLKKWQPRTML